MIVKKLNWRLKRMSNPNQIEQNHNGSAHNEIDDGATAFVLYHYFRDRSTLHNMNKSVHHRLTTPHLIETRAGRSLPADYQSGIITGQKHCPVTGILEILTDG
jgi:hypothetical protein